MNGESCVRSCRSSDGNCKDPHRPNGIETVASIAKALASQWHPAQRIYEKYGHPHEWQHAEQAEIIGYEPSEVPVLPRSTFRISAGMALHWHPSVGSTVVGDTILVTDDGNQVATPATNWPHLQLEIKGATVTRPAILRRGE